MPKLRLSPKFGTYSGFHSDAVQTEFLQKWCFVLYTIFHSSVLRGDANDAVPYLVERQKLFG
ncbi:MAG: hypothetical protein ACYTXC_00920, partial [Nostoc sp.]